MHHLIYDYNAEICHTELKQSHNKQGKNIYKAWFTMQSFYNNFFGAEAAKTCAFTEK